MDDAEDVRNTIVVNETRLPTEKEGISSGTLDTHGNTQSAPATMCAT